LENERIKRKDYLPIVQALAEERTIQLKIGDHWCDIEHISLSDNPELYRIKPEPFECWVVTYPKEGYSPDLFLDKCAAEVCMKQNSDARLARMREVTE
jgi:hypothetical protein